MCNCTFVTKDQVIAIPSESKVKNMKGQCIKGKDPVCRRCHIRLSKRQLQEIERRGYYLSRRH